KPFFYSPEIAKHFDFVSIHAYPDHDKLDENIAALAVYDIGKPLVVEETFPLSCTLDDMDRFVEGGKDRVDGWISHYFGYSIEEHEAGAEPHGIAPDAPFGATVADFLKFWSEKGESIKESQAGGTDGGASGHIKAKTEDGASSAPGGTDGGASGHIGLRVRGSVEQIHIVHAEPNSHVTVDGPSGFQREMSTDDRGGLILRDVPAGSGYRVVVEGHSETPHDVRV
ncbi:MAG: hypothetical protein KDA72_22840, partial [Planctomycetales bacterium]|nr:hypothetical protein [Planctomycetales bacterium]